MQTRHVVVDGSNIATEGRSMPSLAQLDEAVRAFMGEFPEAQVTVVVDATFGHRIDSSEVPAFDEAVANAEIVSPPAGAFGRGDAFLLRIAEKVDADVLSNDSFQEFHGEHEWLFDRGRLIGGKPVPGIGWIFTARSPVRGPKSREAVRKAGRSSVVRDAIKTATDEATSSTRRRGGRGRGGSSSGAKLTPITPRPAGQPNIGDSRPAPTKAEQAETDEASRRRRRGAVPSDPVNEPMVFLGFVASHRPGAKVEGVVQEFTSHGAFVRVGEARCYLPLSAMGNPAPRAARDAVTKGEQRTFIVQALDPPRRGIELALPGFAQPSGAPSAETVEQEIRGSRGSRGRRATADKTIPDKAAPKKAAAKKAAKKATPEKVAAEKTTPEKKAAVKKTPVKKAAAAPKPTKAAAVKKAAAKKAPAKKTAAKKATPAKATAKTTAKRVSKKAAAPPAG